MRRHSKFEALSKQHSLRLRATWRALLLSSVACGFVMPAVAQSVGLEEIVVTARKREETLREVPVAVSALSADDIERMNIDSGSDVLGRVPNLFVTGNGYFGSSFNFTIRGVGSHTPLEPAVAVFVDGIYMPSLGWDLSFLETERLEILRGPQGTLFGRNTQAGAINIVTRKPDDETFGKLRLEVDEFKTVNANGFVAGPITDTLSVSVAGLAHQTDGYIRNVTLGDDLLDRSKYGGRVQFVLRPNDNLTVAAAVDGVFEEGGFYGQGQPLDGTIKALPHWQVRYDVKQHEELNNYGVSLNIDYDLDVATLSSITGYRILDSRALSDIDSIDTPDLDGRPTVIVPPLVGRGFPVPNQNYMFLLRDQSILSQELRLTSNATSDFKWLVGAYTFSEDNDASRNFPVPDSFNFTNSTNMVVDNVDQKRDGYALFAQGNYQLTDNLEIAAGARYAYEKIEQTLTMNFIIGGGVLRGNFSANPSNSYRDVSPMASLMYKINDDIMTYFTVSKGFKGGGFNPSAPTDPVANFSFDEETSWMYELGAKTSYFDNRMTLDAAAFWVDIKDMQVSISRILAGAVTSTGITNAAKARSKGFEMELAALPFPELRIGASVGYTNAVYKDYINDARINLSGQPVEDTPDWIGAIDADYTVGLSGDLEAVFGGTYRYVGEARYGNGTPSTPHFQTESYDQFDVRAGLHTDVWEVTLFADNVFNSYNIIWKGGFSTFYRRPTEAFGQRAAPPRRIGLKGTYRF